MTENDVGAESTTPPPASTSSTRKARSSDRRPRPSGSGHGCMLPDSPGSHIVHFGQVIDCKRKSCFTISGCTVHGHSGCRVSARLAGAGAVAPERGEDDRQLARHRHRRLAEADALGEPHGPGLERRAPPHSQDIGNVDIGRFTLLTKIDAGVRRSGLAAADIRTGSTAAPSAAPRPARRSGARRRRGPRRSRGRPRSPGVASLSFIAALPMPPRVFSTASVALREPERGADALGLRRRRRRR